MECQNKHNIDQKDEETQDDREGDGGTNFILRSKEQETRQTLHEQMMMMMMMMITIKYNL
jgi:hypothetical protein